ncbi:MAG: Tat pathway signal protein [Candidatus Omnitrophica bacterium CG11_big_fil_rev_8_21_14_0_20_45_26]|uniref:Tat pathway signal protein n=1 Tax=Candidatus Abzuiibacterium crystallinum TaxID=1974748 RepID=A0A2H0LM94_9BACT|nr:MAG: Tat pathway signal protein [Candidatus Omnitrophica bacterium CG11_big_fil_rev_8_21_14_0_20_45_26]PIW63662.1 MAG: Tat pathway signal protein [Candidatus Omnitrophica bacterium CG12_big_fil_rev_8_21_14_0_65_45_16]
MKRFVCGILSLVFILHASAIPLSAGQADSLAESDRHFLNQVQRDSFYYFLKFRNPHTGLTLDSSSPGSPASIAATGFALASFAIAKGNGWMGYRDAYEAVEQVLTTLESKAAGHRGFYYHFLEPNSGKRAWSSELSSIDTALLMAGVLLAGEYFKGTDLYTRAQALYEKVDWDWMLNQSLLMSHGWKPSSGFLPHYWDMYSEHLVLQALALGSPTHGIPKKAWGEWVRYEDEFEGHHVVYSFSGSLFTYQYSHMFLDFSRLNDQGINYFENSRNATLANQAFCAMYPDLYGDGNYTWWGLSASLGPNGYKAYGAKPGTALHDGTIAPYAIAGSIIFTPEASLEALKRLYETYGNQIYGEFGFKDAFNVTRDWWADEYIGIDQGSIVLMLENYLHDGIIWEKMMRHPAIQRWMTLCDLQAKENRLS